MYLNNKDANGNKRDENHLWAALCKGERQALDQLFRAFQPSLFHYGMKIIPEEEQVKDSIQELFLKLWKQRTSISQAQSVEVYLLYSLRRILLRKIERRKLRYERNKKYLDEAFTISFSNEEVIINEEFNRERKRKLLDAIELLNPSQKETLFLRYYHGLTNGEIADVMGINKQSVRNNLSRAIGSLRSLVQFDPIPD